MDQSSTFVVDISVLSNDLYSDGECSPDVLVFYMTCPGGCSRMVHFRNEWSIGAVMFMLEKLTEDLKQ